MTMAKSMGLEQDFDVINDNDQNINDFFDTYLKPNLSTTKICYNSAGCWGSGYSKYKNGSNAEYATDGAGIGWNIVTAVLNDGTFINVDSYSKGTISREFGVDINSDNGLIFYVDINGAREPNTIGSDIFAFVYKDGSIVPAFSDRSKAQIEADCSSTSRGISCVNKYLYRT